MLELSPRAAVWMWTASHPHRSFVSGGVQRFSIGLRSGECGGHTRSFSPFVPLAAKDAEAFLAGWDCDALQDDFSTESLVLLYVPRKKVISQRSFSHLQGPCSPMTPTQSTTPASPCWCDSLDAPSGASGAARLSSVNKTSWKLVFTFYWTHCSRFCLWSLGSMIPKFRRNCKPLGAPTPWLTWLGTPEASAALRSCLLISNGISAMAFLNQCFCLAGTRLNVLLSAQTGVGARSGTNLPIMVTLKFSWNISTSSSTSFHSLSKALDYFERDSFPFPYYLEMVIGLRMWNTLFK